MSTAQLGIALRKGAHAHSAGRGVARQEPEAKKRDTWPQHTLAT